VSRTIDCGCCASAFSVGEATQRRGKRRQIGLDYVADGGDVDSEILVHEEVAGAADLRLGDLWVCIGEHYGEVLRRLEDVGDAEIGAATHRAIASASADSEIDGLSSCTGKISMSSRPNSVPVSSMRQEARMSTLPSVSSMCTTMSMSLAGPASPRATEPNSRGCVALYFASSASNSCRRALSSSRRASVSGVAAAIDMT